MRTFPAARWPALAGLLLPLLGACAGYGTYGFDPPAEPAHDDWEDGYAHASGKSTPFLCRDPDSGDRVTCPQDWPEDRNLSCDAAGCHGGFEYDTDPQSDSRDLLGGAGPSCYSCHGKEWSSRKD